MKKITITLLLVSFATIVLAQKKFRYFVELQPTFNINAWDIPKNPNMMTSKGLFSYGGSVGTFIHPKKRKFGVKLMAGVQQTPQKLELYYKESYSGKNVSTTLKHNDLYGTLKAMPTWMFAFKNKRHIELGIGFTCLYSLNKFKKNDIKLFTETYTDPSTGENVTLLNSVASQNWGTHVINGDFPRVIAQGNVDVSYKFESVFNEKKSMYAGISLGALISTGATESYGGHVLATTFYSTPNERIRLEQSMFYDRRIQVGIVLGMEL